VEAAQAGVLFWYESLFLGFPDVMVQRDSNEREEHTDQHTELHAKLFGREAQGSCKGAGCGICNNGIGDHTDQLRANGGAQIAAGSHQRIDEHTTLRETSGSDDQITGPEHGGTKAGKGTGEKSDDRSIGEGGGQIADGCADSAEGQDLADVFAVVGVEGAAKAEHHCKQCHTEQITPDFGNAQCLLQIAGTPLRHRAFCRTTEEDGKDTEPQTFVF